MSKELREKYEFLEQFLSKNSQSKEKINLELTFENLYAKLAEIDPSTSEEQSGLALYRNPQFKIDPYKLRLI